MIKTASFSISTRHPLTFYSSIRYKSCHVSRFLPFNYISYNCQSIKTLGSFNFRMLSFQSNPVRFDPKTYQPIFVGTSPYVYLAKQAFKKKSSQLSETDLTVITATKQLIQRLLEEGTEIREVACDWRALQALMNLDKELRIEVMQQLLLDPTSRILLFNTIDYLPLCQEMRQSLFNKDLSSDLKHQILYECLDRLILILKQPEHSIQFENEIVEWLKILSKQEIKNIKSILEQLISSGRLKLLFIKDSNSGLKRIEAIHLATKLIKCCKIEFFLTEVYFHYLKHLSEIPDKNIFKVFTKNFHTKI